jgi:hypothetical protein
MQSLAEAHLRLPGYCNCLSQNLLGNDCAKARVSLCVKADPLCLPTQNVVSETGRPGSPEAAQQVATALDAQCTVAEPSQAGTKVSLLSAHGLCTLAFHCHQMLFRSVSIFRLSASWACPLRSSTGACI